jgi:hypothetical protein
VNPETASAAWLVAKASNSRSPSFFAVLGPAWKWLVDKNTELIPWRTLPGLYRDSRTASIPAGNVAADFTRL